MTSLDGARAALDARVNAIEEAYEFFLAYASQGLPSDSAGGSGSQIRDYLGRCDRALNGLGACIMQFVQHLAIEPSPYRAYVNVVDRDISKGAAVRALRDANYSTSSFNGTFTFSSLNGTTDLTCHDPTDPRFLPATSPCPVSYSYAQQQLRI